jgi:hypothetical protein
MKKIYAGSELAVVVLDSPEEIQLVVEALQTALPYKGWAADERDALIGMAAEMLAAAPE